MNPKGEKVGDSIFLKRVADLNRRLDGSSFDSAWIIQPENRRYLSGFRAEDSQFTESSGSLLISRASLILAVDSRYTTVAETEAVDFYVHTFPKSLVEDFPGLLDRIGTKHLGFEEDYLTWGLHHQVSEKLGSLSPPVDIMPLKGLVEEMRAVKDDHEITAIETSAEMISEILDEIISGLKPGMSEKEIEWKIENLAREAGADGLAFSSIVASGPNSALPHAVPTNRKLEKNEPVTLDVGVRLDGYCSDITRTVFLGEPDAYFKKIYKIVRQAQLAALKEIRPGVLSTHPDGVARQVISDAGFGKYFGHSLGHGVGLATHERPSLAPRKPVELKKGMIVTVEPGIYIPGKGGVRLEEMVVIEEAGARILTKSAFFYDFSPQP